MELGALTWVNLVLVPASAALRWRFSAVPRPIASSLLGASAASLLWIVTPLHDLPWWTILFASGVGVAGALALDHLVGSKFVNREAKSMDDSRKPRVNAGIYLENSSDCHLEGNRIAGFEHGIVDVGGKNNRHINNQIDTPDRVNDGAVEDRASPRPRKYFSGWRPGE